MTVGRSVASVLASAAVALVASACSDADTPPEANVLTGAERVGEVPGDPSDGESLFIRTCSSCHGDEGKGGFGPSLVDSVVAERYELVVDRIENGVDLMPAFGPVLTDDEVADIAAYVVRVLADREVPPLAPGAQAGGPERVTDDDLLAPSGTSLAEGRDVYLSSCASCHGPDGGGTEVAPSLVDERIPYDQVASIVRGGQPAMPAFSVLLGDAEIAAVSAYVTEHLMLGNPVEPEHTGDDPE